MSKSNRNISKIESGVGYLMGVVQTTADLVREKDLSFEAIYRLATPAGRRTLERMVEIAQADWDAEQPKNSAEKAGLVKQFKVHMAYVQPEFEDLKRRFAFVSPDYEGKRFDLIEHHKTVPTNVGNREVTFEYVHMGRAASTHDLLAEMDRRGLRPALYEELLGFAEKYPEEQRKFPIVALGSETGVDVSRRVAYLWNGADGRSLGLRWIDDDWGDGCRFLAVRKQHSSPATACA